MGARSRAFVIMVDLSDSMSRVSVIDGVAQRIGDVGVDWLNMLLMKLFMLAHGDGYELNQYDVAVVGYSGRGVVSLLGDNDDPFVSALQLSKLHKNSRWLKFRSISPLDSPDDYEELTEKCCLVEFYESKPMFEAYHSVMEWLDRWFDGREDGAAIVMNITSDGAPTDSRMNEIHGISEKIKNILQGEVMMLNMVLSESIDPRHCSLFPTDDELYHNPNAMFRTLGETSSSLRGIEAALPIIHKLRSETSDGDYKGIVSNKLLIDLLPILTSK